eukprot:gene12030-13272_t
MPKLKKRQSIDDYGGCTVSGKGLEVGVVGKPTSFFIHTATVDLLYLELSIQAPSYRGLKNTTVIPDIYCIEPYLHGVVFCPTVSGKYTISIKWNGVDVYGSPFSVRQVESELELKGKKLQSLKDDDAAKEHKKQTMSCCKWDENTLVGGLFVDKSQISLEELKKEEFMSEVEKGGSWHPRKCAPKSKVAIIVPFRNRDDQIPILLRQLHPILQRQKLEYQIFIIDQADDYPFNRAKLFNVGFKEALKHNDFDCFVFHDVDLIPEDDRNDYGCPSSPRHMCPSVDKFNYEMFSPYLFGGVTAFTKQHFTLINGYANRYWGWGAEDDDCFKRVNTKDLKVTRPAMELGRYKMLGHSQQERNGKAILLLEKGDKNMKDDGINTLKYKVFDQTAFDLFTKIKVDLQMTAEEKNLTTLKQRKTN